jgi:DNA-binding NarL/FixJ family response regulator
MMALRIVLAEDNFLVREGIRRMLTSDSDLDVVGTAGDLDELLRLIDEFRPDVVLTDIRMPPEHSDEGLRAAEHCRDRYPEMGVILLSQYVESDYVRILLEHGTDRRGYLLKERVAELDDLVLALREVSKGGSALDPKVVEVLVHNRSAQRGAALARLTPRELDVLEAMAQGHTNSAIAEELVLSVRAVEKHINSIFSKLGLSGDQSTHPRVRAVLLYLSEETPPA